MFRPRKLKVNTTDQKTFLLCVGAQKAGTTWLHDYLAGHKACYTGKIKEQHIFDVASQPEIYGPSQARQLKRAADLLAQKAETPHKDTKKIDVHLRVVLERILMRLAPDTYLDYYRRQFRDDPSKTLFTDITPSYSGLTKDALVGVREIFEGSEFNLRILFLMRDPLDRLYSAMKMIDRKITENRGVPSRTAPARFAKNYASVENEVRSRYENTITNLEAVFPRENLHYEFYETLFQEDSVRKICDFLDIAYVKPNFGRHVNASPSSDLPDPEAISAARAHYDKTYQFCIDRFGEEHIHKIWAYA